jgi:hypothetical protein
MSKCRLVPLIVAFSLLSGVPVAEATPVTIGASLSGPFSSGSCSGECTILGAGSSPSYTSPVDGVIVHWGIFGGEAGRPYKLRVFTPGAGGAFTAAGTTATATPVGAGAESFPSDLPIKAGQTIGIDLEATAPLGWNSSAGSYTFIEPHPADGETQTPGSPVSGEWAYNAQIQPVPKITAISPTTGTTAGGAQVSIAGTDFEGTTAVRFGSTPAASFTIDSENLITASAPAGSGSVPISVTTVAGTSTSSQLFTFATPAIAPLPVPVPQPATCTVPKIKGGSLKAAKRRIRSADCAVGKPIKKSGATAENGKVVKQQPAPGTTVPVGTKVKVTLSPRTG